MRQLAALAIIFLAATASAAETVKLVSACRDQAA